jgi:ABC-type nitrate/sulfonate/bicarbonate transport system substrate-binding protein
VRHSLVVGSFTPSVYLDVARTGGYLEAHDVAVQEVPVTSSPAQFQALIDGDLDVGLTSPDNVLAYRFSPTNPLARLADARIVSTVDRGLGLSLWLRPGPEAVTPQTVPELLRGATVAVDVATSGFALAMYALIESWGVTRDEYELVTLGSTPHRLEALVEGRCDATMLNAGNDLRAGQAACRRVSSVAESGPPYVGTVVCVVGDRRLEAATAFADALRATARDIVAGHHDEAATHAAQSLLHLPRALAQQFVEMLKDPAQGLITSDAVDVDGLRTVAALRRRFLPELVDGPHSPDVLDAAFDRSSGLLVFSP